MERILMLSKMHGTTIKNNTLYAQQNWIFDVTLLI